MPTDRKRRTAITAAAVLLLGGVVAVPAASAGEGDGEAAAQSRHCTLDAETGEIQCFESFTGAIDSASGGRIDDAPASAREAAEDSGFKAETKQLAASARAKADGDVIAGTFFDDKEFGGDSLTITTAGLCPKDGWVNYQTDLGDDWKNRISSVQPWANCALWLYPEPGLGGDRDGPFDENTADIGTLMNDRTQSIGFS